MSVRALRQKAILLALILVPPSTPLDSRDVRFAPVYRFLLQVIASFNAQEGDLALSGLNELQQWRRSDVCAV